MALWTPADLDTPPEMWLDASDASTLTIDDGKISEWRDKIGNHDFTQEIATNRPLLTEAGLNGLDIATFSAAAGNHLITSAPLVTTANFSYFQVLCRAAAGEHTFSLSTTATYGAPYAPYWYNDNATYSAVSAATHVTHRAANTETGWRLWSYVRNSTNNCRLFENATSIGGEKSAGSVGTSSPNDRLTWFGKWTNVYTNGPQAEIIALAYEVDTETRQKIEGYLAHKWGLSDDLPSDHPYKDAAPTIPVNTIRAICDQIYGLKLQTTFTQRYGDTPQFRAICDQIYGSAAVLRRLCLQKYGDARHLVSKLTQVWVLQANVRGILNQDYHATDSILRAILTEKYDIKEYEQLRSLLSQYYVIKQGGYREQQPQITVVSNGKRYHPKHITIEATKDNFVIQGEMHLSLENEYFSITHLQEFTIDVSDTTFTLLVDLPKYNEPATASILFVVPLVSPAILLDTPHALGVSKTFTGGMASSLAKEIVADFNIEIDWQLVDWYIPAGKLIANGESPIEVLRRLVEAVGGILQSAPDGSLICQSEYIVSFPQHKTATPAHTLIDSINFFSIDSSPEEYEGFNQFLVTDQEISVGGNGLTIEQRDIDDQTKEVLVYQVPWANNEIVLRTSGGSWVQILKNGIVTELISDEIVEIILGEGQLDKPYYALSSSDYQETDLGGFDITEDGYITTSTKANTLIKLSYFTKYHLFRVSDPNIEEVQFYPEVIE